MGTPLQIRGLADYIYGYAESSAYKTPWVYNPDFSLDAEPDISVIARRNARIAHAWDARCKMIVRDWHVDKPRKSKDDAEQKLADVCEESVSFIEYFDAARYRLAEGTILGRDYEYIGGRIVHDLELGGTKPMDWWVPTSLTNVDRRRFRWAPVWDYSTPQNPKMHVIQEFWSVVRQKWEPLTPEKTEYFLRYIPYQAEERLGYSLPLLESAFFTHYLATVGLEKAAEGVDRWANSMLVAEIKGLRNASTGKTNEDLKAGAITMLQKMRTEHVGVIEVGDKITAVEPSGTGHQMTSWMIEDAYNALDLLFTGSAFSPGKEGSRAKDQVQAEQGESYVQYERRLQDEVISRQLFNLFVRVNWPNIVELGLDKARMPRFTSDQVERIDPEKWVTTAGQLLDRGLPMVKEELYRKAGAKVPGDDDDVVMSSMTMGADGEGGGDIQGGTGGVTAPGGSAPGMQPRQKGKFGQKPKKAEKKEPNGDAE